MERIGFQRAHKNRKGARILPVDQLGERMQDPDKLWKGRRMGDMFTFCKDPSTACEGFQCNLCSYFGDRRCHALMHYKRIHIKHGVPIQGKRKYVSPPHAGDCFSNFRRTKAACSNKRAHFCKPSQENPFHDLEPIADLDMREEEEGGEYPHAHPPLDIPEEESNVLEDTPFSSSGVPEVPLEGWNEGGCILRDLSEPTPICNTESLRVESVRGGLRVFFQGVLWGSSSSSEARHEQMNTMLNLSSFKQGVSLQSSSGRGSIRVSRLM